MNSKENIYYRNQKPKLRLDNGRNWTCIESEEYVKETYRRESRMYTKNRKK